MAGPDARSLTIRSNFPRGALHAGAPRVALRVYRFGATPVRGPRRRVHRVLGRPATRTAPPGRGRRMTGPLGPIFRLEPLREVRWRENPRDLSQS